MTRVETFTFSPYQTNCYVCYRDRDAVLVDASTYNAQDREEVESFLHRNGLVLRHLLLTHAHVDHILGCAYFTKKFGMQWTAHRASTTLLRFGSVQAAAFGTPLEKPPLPIVPVKEGDVITFGSARLEVLHTPGHAPGSVCFYDREAGFVLVGDVLFHGSIGRYDLPGGNLSKLMKTIFQKLLTLPDDTVVYSGHGPVTTIGRERIHNPFLMDAP